MYASVKTMVDVSRKFLGDKVPIYADVPSDSLESTVIQRSMNASRILVYEVSFSQVFSWRGLFYCLLFI